MNMRRANSRLPARYPVETRMQRAARQVALELGVAVGDITDEILGEHRCIKNNQPKIMIATLAEAKDRAEHNGHRFYPCRICNHWHLTSGAPWGFPKVFVCQGCQLQYARQNNADQRFCSKGCRRRYNARKHREHQASRPMWTTTWENVLLSAARQYLAECRERVAV